MSPCPTFIARYQRFRFFSSRISYFRPEKLALIIKKYVSQTFICIWAFWLCSFCGWLALILVKCLQVRKRKNANKRLLRIYPAGKQPRSHDHEEKKTSTVAFMYAAFYFCRSSSLKCDFSLCFMTDFNIGGRNRKVTYPTLGRKS